MNKQEEEDKIMEMYREIPKENRILGTIGMIGFRNTDYETDMCIRQQLIAENEKWTEEETKWKKKHSHNTQKKNWQK